MANAAAPSTCPMIPKDGKDLTPVQIQTLIDSYELTLTSKSGGRKKKTGSQHGGTNGYDFECVNGKAGRGSANQFNIDMIQEIFKHSDPRTGLALALLQKEFLPLTPGQGTLIDDAFKNTKEKLVAVFVSLYEQYQGKGDKKPRAWGIRIYETTGVKDVFMNVNVGDESKSFVGFRYTSKGNSPEERAEMTSMTVTDVAAVERELRKHFDSVLQVESCRIAVNLSGLTDIHGLFMEGPFEKTQLNAIIDRLRDIYDRNQYLLTKEYLKEAGIEGYGAHRGGRKLKAKK